MSAPTLGWAEPAAAAPTQSLFSVAAIRHVLTAFLATRLIIFAIVVLSLVAIPMRQGDFFFADADNILLDGLVRYDSWWYSDIIADGYSLGDVASGAQGNIAFFPLYPLLIQLVMKLSGSTSPFLPAVLIANGSFLLGLFYLYALAAAEFDQATAARTVFYLAAAPAALFFSAFYTEGLYTLLIAATFYHSR
ncbi:MAG: hypothetical protein KDE09_17620, partial [Anaerolineales bacterium]|nr:hypothetical protein [Anaerolineales bacterium]